MTREQTKELLKRGILQAFAEGKTIQLESASGWRDAAPPLDFTCSAKSYRIKPEPREFWINVYDGEMDLYPSKVIADECADSGRLERLHVREVL